MLAQGEIESCIVVYTNQLICVSYAHFLASIRQQSAIADQDMLAVYNDSEIGLARVH